MKKYIVTMLLALALVASMTACDKDNGKENPTETSASSTSSTEATTSGNTEETTGELVVESATPGESEADTPSETDPTTGTETNAPAGTETDPLTGTETDVTIGTETEAPVGTETDTTPVETVPANSTITLNFNGTRISAADANGTPLDGTKFIAVSGNAFVINQPGSYELKGDLSGAQLCVQVDKAADVELILNNFTASCNTSAPLYIKSANKATIVLAAGSVNTLTDATMYQFPVGEDKPNACLYSSDDLTIKGTGSLTVNGRFNNGIGCKNDLRIKSGTITVTAVNNILKGNDSVEIEEATLTLRGGEDAIKADNELKAGKGYIHIMAGAKVDINCTDDALQAATSITVEAGATVTGTAAGDATNCPGVITVDETAMQLKSATQP